LFWDQNTKPISKNFKQRMSLEMEAESSEVGEEEGKPSGGNQVLIIDDDITKLSKKGLLELCLLQNWQWSFFLNG